MLDSTSVTVASSSALNSPGRRLDPATGFTCLACRLVFSNGQLQRDHYRGEWHLYNMRRQVANLDPVSEQVFLDKVQQFAQQEHNQKTQNIDGFASDGLLFDTSGALLCVVCGRNKKFRTRAAYNNHLRSRRHQTAVAASGAKPNSEALTGKSVIETQTESMDVDESSEYEEEEDGIPVEECLFCGRKFDHGWEASLEHMALLHGFSIPDLPFCTDLPGLLTYLGFKIGVGLTCIRCQCGRFRSLDALRKHMRDSNHCNFRIDGNAEGEGNALLEFMDFYDYSEQYEDGPEGDEETDSTMTLYEEGGFLVLPSGARIGHRSLMRYFRQKLRPARNEPGKGGGGAGTGKSLASTKLKQLGWTGTSGSLAVAHARDVAFMKRTVNRMQLKRELASNKLFISRGRKDQQ